LVFIGLAAMAANLSGISGFYMAGSRVLCSMASDIVLPSWFGNLHSKYSTPANAIVCIMLIALLAPFFGWTALVWIVDMSSIGAAIGYGYTSAAAFKYAINEKNKWIMVTGLIGIIMSLFFVVLLLIPIPGLDCSLGKESYFCLVIWSILGIFFYFY